MKKSLLFSLAVLFLSYSLYDGSQGAWSPVENEEEIKLDLGGSYLTVGIMLRLGRKTL